MRRIGSLCSGIGGLELGLEWAGVGHTAWQVEHDASCRDVLARHWPEADRSVTDVVEAANVLLPRVDVVCAGIPCQPFSQAGKRAGLADERWLWPYVERIVASTRPSVVVIENVAGFIRRGLDPVVAGLTAQGFTVEATMLGAHHVGAPHRRDRIFVVAYRNSCRRQIVGGTSSERAGRAEQEQEDSSGDVADRCSRAAASVVPDGHGGLVRDHEQRVSAGRPRGLRDERDAVSHDGCLPAGREPQPAVGGSPDGLPCRLDPTSRRGAQEAWPAPPGHARHDWEPAPVIDASARDGRSHRRKMLGNAVVPQVAQIVGLRIRELMGWE